MRLRLVPILILSAAMAAAASIAAVYGQKPGGSPSSPAPPPARASVPGPPAAEVDGVVISTGDVDAALGQTLAKLQEEIYATRLGRLDAMIDDRLIAKEAAKRGLTPAAFTDAEITARSAKVSDSDIAAFFEQNRGRLPGDLPKWQEQIRSYLEGQRLAAARAVVVKRLRDAAQVKVYLSPPPVFRADVSVAGASVRGNAAAAVTIVEFSDFHCPFCRQVQPVLTQLLQKYGSRVRLVYKDMPLDTLHGQARTVAESGRCAADQGRFWEFHDKVYANPPDGSAATLQRLAQEVGLDAARFEACRSSRKFEAEVERDVQEGIALGITGTPGFFINGRFLNGAQPIEAFTRIIDQELADPPKPAAR